MYEIIEICILLSVQQYTFYRELEISSLLYVTISMNTNHKAILHITGYKQIKSSDNIGKILQSSTHSAIQRKLQHK